MLGGEMVDGERTLWSDGLGAELLCVGRVCGLRRHRDGVVCGVVLGEGECLCRYSDSSHSCCELWLVAVAQN